MWLLSLATNLLPVLVVASIAWAWAALVTVALWNIVDPFDGGSEDHILPAVWLVICAVGIFLGVLNLVAAQANAVLAAKG